MGWVVLFLIVLLILAVISIMFFTGVIWGTVRLLDSLVKPKKRSNKGRK